jgi:hypothetical protein
MRIWSQIWSKSKTGSTSCFQKEFRNTIARYFANLGRGKTAYDLTGLHLKLAGELSLVMNHKVKAG